MICEIKRLNCGSCMELRRVKIRDGVEPECPKCGPTHWIALPVLTAPAPPIPSPALRLEAAIVQAAEKVAQDLTEVLQSMGFQVVARFDAAGLMRELGVPPAQAMELPHWAIDVLRDLGDL